MVRKIAGVVRASDWKAALKKARKKFDNVITVKFYMRRREHFGADRWNNVYKVIVNGG